MDLFDIQIDDRINITSKYSFNKYFTVIVYNSQLEEIYRTQFNFIKDIVYWIGLENSEKNLTIHILDENDIIYIHESKKDFAYVTCGDINYMDIIEKLVISLLNTSSMKIIVYGINCKVPFDYPNLIKRELNVVFKSNYDKWFWKQLSCIESINEGYSNYVWVDGDIICNNNIDNISEYFKEIDNYPIADVHVQDEQIMVMNGVSQLMGEHISNYFGTPRKILKKNIHACFFIYNQKCKWFFGEILDLYNEIYKENLYERLLAWNDESLHNFLMSKYGFTKTLPLSNLSLLCEHTKYISNPKIMEYFYSYWNDDSPNNFGDFFGWNYVPEDKNQILYFHENKNLNNADEMINFIKLKKGNNFNESKWFFINKNKIINFESDRSSYLTKLYDESKMYEYKDLLYIEPGDTILDIGADIGFFERYSYLKKASKIICFESDKDKFEILKLNSNKNSMLFMADIDNINYSIDYLLDKLSNRFDMVKIDKKGKEWDIVSAISDDSFLKIKKISIKWYGFNILSDNEKNKIVDYFLQRGFNCFVDIGVVDCRLYIYK